MPAMLHPADPRYTYVWGPRGPVRIPADMWRAYRRGTNRRTWFPRIDRLQNRRGMLFVDGAACPPQHNTGATGSVPGTSVTTGASADTKGTAVELIAATTFDTYFVQVCAVGLNSNGVDSRTCLDILAGAATEDVLIANLLAGGAGALTNGQVGKTWMFPLFIPAGTRIAAQAAGQRTSFAFNVSVLLFQGPVPPFGVGNAVTTYGIGTVPSGTPVTPGGSGSEGAWTEITSSTAREHMAAVPSFQHGDDTTSNQRILQLDIGMGAAAAEVELFGGYWFGTAAGEEMNGPMNPLPTPCDIPAGTRLAVRASSHLSVIDNYEAALHLVS